MVYQFQKLASKKQSAKQRDIDLFERYGRDDFMTEREKLNISFHDLKEIEHFQQQKQFKISVRNTLGIKQNDDWIYNLNIGNVMHLSLMGSDELAAISSIQKDLSTLRDGSQDTQKTKETKNLFETSHELCKDAMLEKIVLISVSYFCIATEMRFILQKQANKGSQIVKRDSEMYHAKALHIASIFLPRDCPLVQHVQQSYLKNYLKEKKPFELKRFLENIGIQDESSSESKNSASEESNTDDIDEGLAPLQAIKSCAVDGVKKSTTKKLLITKPTGKWL